MIKQEDDDLDQQADLFAKNFLQFQLEFLSLRLLTLALVEASPQQSEVLAAYQAQLDAFEHSRGVVLPAVQIAPSATQSNP